MYRACAETSIGKFITTGKCKRENATVFTTVHWMGENSVVTGQWCCLARKHKLLCTAQSCIHVSSNDIKFRMCVRVHGLQPSQSTSSGNPLPSIIHEVVIIDGSGLPEEDEEEEDNV